MPDFLKLPKQLQQRFYKAAEEEAEVISNRIAVARKFVEIIEPEVRRGMRKLVERAEWKYLRMAFVDGSDTPAIDERLGLRYGLYAAAAKLFKGLDPIEGAEWYIGDRLSDETEVQKDVFKKTLDLITTYCERYLANYVLERYDPDLIVIDGSFFGYRYGCSSVKSKELNWTDPITGRTFERHSDLISELTNLTTKLLISNRAVGIVKRVVSRSIDGYLKYKMGNDVGIGVGDRTLLNLLLDVGELFDFRTLLPEEIWHGYLSEYSTTVRRDKFSRMQREEVLQEVKRLYENQIRADLTDGSGLDLKAIKEAVTSVERVFLKTIDEQPPICIEFPRTIDDGLLNRVLSYALETANPATGFPVCFDLIDELISLPSKLGREFIEEIEARLVMAGYDKRSLVSIFGRVNPQKEAEV